MQYVVSLTALFGIVTALTVGLFSVSRIVMAASRDWLLPPFLARISKRTQTPLVAQMVLGVIIGGWGRGEGRACKLAAHATSLGTPCPACQPLKLVGIKSRVQQHRGLAASSTLLLTPLGHLLGRPTCCSPPCLHGGGRCCHIHGESSLALLSMHCSALPVEVHKGLTGVAQERAQLRTEQPTAWPGCVRLSPFRSLRADSLRSAFTPSV